MIAWSPPHVSEHGSDSASDIEALHQHLNEAENAIIELNRQVTDAIVARNFMKARLARLQGDCHGRRQDQDPQARPGNNVNEDYELREPLGTRSLSR
jgi:hypothetical protein